MGQPLSLSVQSTNFSPCHKQLETCLDPSPCVNIQNWYVLNRSMGECQGTVMMSRLISIMGVATTHGVERFDSRFKSYCKLC